MDCTPACACRYSAAGSRYDFLTKNDEVLYTSCPMSTSRCTLLVRKAPPNAHTLVPKALSRNRNVHVVARCARNRSLSLIFVVCSRGLFASAVGRQSRGTHSWFRKNFSYQKNVHRIPRPVRNGVCVIFFDPRFLSVLNLCRSVDRGH